MYGERELISTDLVSRIKAERGQAIASETQSVDAMREQQRRGRLLAAEIGKMASGRVESHQPVSVEQVRRITAGRGAALEDNSSNV